MRSCDKVSKRAEQLSVHSERIRLQPILAVVLGLGSASAPAAGWEWSARGQLGILIAEGNTNTESASAKLDLRMQRERWRYDFAFAGLHATNQDIIAAQRLETTLQATHEIAKPVHWFVGGRYASDRFSGFDHETSASTGYRHQFIDNDTTKLSAQVGAGYRRLEARLDPVPITPFAGANEDAIVQATFDFEHHLTGTARFMNKLTSESGDFNTLAENRFAFEVKINTRFALSIGSNLRFNSNPPPTRSKSDMTTTVNLVCAIGS